MTELKDVQALELKMLDHTIDILNSLGLKWYAFYGKLLGAIREGGMIPWDDDIDIAMPREDFNHLLEVGGQVFRDPYFFQTPNTDSICNTIIKIRYNGTSAIGKWARDVKFHRGVFIDIFPLDRVPEDIDRINDIRNTIDYIFNVEKYDKSDVVRKPDNFTKNSNSHFFSFFNEFMTHIDKENNNSCFVSCPAMWRYIDSRAIYHADCFEDLWEADFKGLKHKMMIPVGCDEILTRDYGDWLTPKKVDGTHGKLLFDLYRDYSYYDNIPIEEFNGLFE